MANVLTLATKKWFSRSWLGASLFGQRTPTHDAAGSGRRARWWSPGNPSAMSVIAETHAELLSKSRDLARRNVWAHSALEAYVSNAIGTGIKPQSMLTDAALREALHKLWAEWVNEADHSEITDFYGLQALACRAMLEGGECFIRLRRQPPGSGLVVGLQLQLLEAERVPVTLNLTLENGHMIRAGIEFDRNGKRVAYHLLPSHPDDAALAGLAAGQTVRVPSSEIVHLFRTLRPGQIRGEPWLARALIKLEELDQYDDAELVRKKTAAMFAGFVTRLSPEDQLLGEGAADQNGIAVAGMEPGTMQVLEPGEDVKFSQPADVGANYTEFLRAQFRAVAAAMGVTYEQLTGDLSQVNYSSIRAGLLEFRRRVEAIQHGVIVHQLCRPIWRAFVTQAMLEGALPLRSKPGQQRELTAVKWIPQGWQWVDPQKEFNAMKTAIRSGLLSRSEAISAFGYDAEDTDQEIAHDNARADQLGLVFDTDPRSDAERLRAAQKSAKP